MGEISCADKFIVQAGLKCSGWPPIRQAGSSFAILGRRTALWQQVVGAVPP